MATLIASSDCSAAFRLRRLGSHWKCAAWSDALPTALNRRRQQKGREVRMGSISSPDTGTLDQFLQPQSMVTPGALGALAMLATNTLVGNFPNMNAPIIALILSFLLGFAALVKSTSIFEKILYYLLNSIIIFSVAAGANKLGQQIQQTSLSLPTLSAYATPRVDIGALAQSSEQIKFFK